MLKLKNTVDTNDNDNERWFANQSGGSSNQVYEYWLWGEGVGERGRGDLDNGFSFKNAIEVYVPE